MSETTVASQKTDQVATTSNQVAPEAAPGDDVCIFLVIYFQGKM